MRNDKPQRRPVAVPSLAESGRLRCRGAASNGCATSRSAGDQRLELGCVEALRAFVEELSEVRKFLCIDYRGAEGDERSEHRGAGDACDSWVALYRRAEGDRSAQRRRPRARRAPRLLDEYRTSTRYFSVVAALGRHVDLPLRGARGRPWRACAICSSMVQSPGTGSRTITVTGSFLAFFSTIS